MTHYSSDERKRMSNAISGYEARMAWVDAWERIGRLITVAIAVFIPLALFYVATA